MKNDNLGTMRNLDELHEADETPGSKVSAVVLASIGGALIVFAAFLLVKSPSRSNSEPHVDPLGDLVSKVQPGSTASPSLDVTFPRLLSSAASPTTALEAVRDGKKAVEDPEFVLPPGHPTAPPPALDRLPVVPLPAQQILAEAGRETTAPSDSLTSMARHASRETGTEVERGAAGGFQLQVSSFNDATEAEAFAAALRRRGHRAYVEPAYVKGRGLWHRVRIGPFKYKRSADTYRQEFEAKERLVTFIVSPPKTKVRLGEGASTGVRESSGDTE